MLILDVYLIIWYNIHEVRNVDKVKSVVYGEYFADMSKGGVVYSANDGFMLISGYDQQDIDDGKVNLFDFIPEELLAKYKRLVSESTDGMKPVLIQHPLIKKDGSVITVLCYGFPFEEDGIGKARILITDYTEHMNLISKYNSSQSELDALISAVPGGVVILEIKSGDLSIFKTNDEFLNMMESDKNLAGSSFRSLMDEESFEGLYKKVCICAENNGSLDFEFKRQQADGTYKWFRIYGNLYKHSNGLPLFYTVVMDITNDIRLCNELSVEIEKFKVIADNTDELYFEYDVENDSMRLTTTLSRYMVNDQNCIENYLASDRPREFVHPKEYDKFITEYKKFLESARRGSFEVRTKAYDDDYTWYNVACVSFENEQNKVVKVFGRLACIQHLKSLKKKIDKDSKYITYLLETDSLTGLLNRHTFVKKAEEVLNSPDHNCVYGFVYSDINEFSYVNENFGFQAGNDMLKDLAECVLDLDTNVLGCRIYSDFFIGLYKANTREELISSIEKRNIEFTNKQKIKYPASDIRISCGIYVVTDTLIDVNVAIDNANLARRSVKNNSSVIYGIYSGRMRTQRAYEQSICSELHPAIDNREIEMFLQPKFNLVDRTIIGAETLARWRNKDGSYKMPFEFIPVLEKVGYIDELDFFIFEEALSTLEKWKKQNKKLLPLSVNFSQKHIFRPDFAKNIISTAQKYDVDPSLVELEITESSFSGDTAALFNVMDKLRSYGFMISIDDFGIGYSTLSVLMKAPVDIVKIDKSFIDNIAQNKMERSYVSNMCKLIETAQKDVIFEGVETEDQAKILSESGYTKAQGYLFERPIPLNDFNEKFMSD